MRILQVTPRVASVGLDGGRIAMRNLAAGLRAAGAEVVTLSLNPAKHFVDPSIAGCETFPIDTSKRFAGVWRSARKREPLNVARFWSDELARRIASVARSFDVVLLEELALAPYIDVVRRNSDALVVLRPLNVESQVWRRLAGTGSPLVRAARSALAGWIEHFETSAIAKSDACLTVTEEDAAHFRRANPRTSFHVAPVGLLLDEYDATPSGANDIAFIGSLDYAPNTEGLAWFLEKVWPTLKSEGAALAVAGSGATPEIAEMVRKAGADYLGRVDDAKRFVREHTVIIAPLLAGGGMRVKIVEALALGRAVVTTSVGAEGLGAIDGTQLRIADDAASFVSAIRELLADGGQRLTLARNGRKLVAEKFDAAAIGRETLAFCERLVEVRSPESGVRRRLSVPPIAAANDERPRGQRTSTQQSSSTQMVQQEMRTPDSGLRTPDSQHNERPRAVVLTARAPWPPYTGDRLRTTHWLDALSRDYDVTLVSPREQEIASGIDFVPLNASLRRFVTAAFEVLRRGLPLHYLFAGRYDWDRAMKELARKGEFEAAVVVLTRAAAWIDVRSFARGAVLDAVDSLSENMEERAAHASIFSRLVWSIEAKRTARDEARAGATFDAITLTAASDRASFGRVVTAVPVGIEIAPLDTSLPRRFDFGFWGRLPYFANRDAVELLLSEIWPWIRAKLPTATLLIGGAGVTPKLLEAAGRDGVEVISPMYDRPQMLRQVRVALLPVRYGTGQSTKVLEAAEAGCAIVAMPRALRGQEGFPAAGAVVEEYPERLAEAACRVLADAKEREALASAARKWVAEHCDLSQNLEQMRSLVRQVSSR